MNYPVAAAVVLSAAMSSSFCIFPNYTQDWAAQAQSAARNGNMVTAERYFLYALSQTCDSPNRIAHAANLELAAAFYQANERADKAMSMYKEAIAIRRGFDHPQLVADLRAAADLAEASGDKRQSEEYMQEAIEICQRQAGGNTAPMF
ncbi:MAG TPA: tetratricopeptide repeat protein [Planktothrix sp.]|jgi:tetratricopeptide (TPR) repeat protein